MGAPSQSVGNRFPVRVRDAIPIWGVVALLYQIGILVLAGWRLSSLLGGDAVIAGSGMNQAWAALCSGAAGGAMISSRYVVYAIRHGVYDARRLPWQILTPLHSAVLALVALGLVKAGLITITSSWGAQEPQYTMFLLTFSFLVGFAGESFVKRLIMAAESLFGERGDLTNADGGEDPKKSD